MILSLFGVIFSSGKEVVGGRRCGDESHQVKVLKVSDQRGLGFIGVKAPTKNNII